MKRTMPILIVLFMIASRAYAQGFDAPDKEECCPQRHEMGQLMRLEMLDLTDEQREAIHSARLEARKKIIPLKAEIELKTLDLHNEMSMDSPNRNKIMQLAKDINGVELKIKQTRLDERLKIQSVLTPEQRKQVKRSPHKVLKKKIIKHLDDL